MNSKERARRRTRVKKALATLVQADEEKVKKYEDLETSDQEHLGIMSDALIELVDALLEPNVGGK